MVLKTLLSKTKLLLKLVTTKERKKS